MVYLKKKHLYKLLYKYSILKFKIQKVFRQKILGVEIVNLCRYGFICMHMDICIWKYYISAKQICEMKLPRHSQTHMSETGIEWREYHTSWHVTAIPGDTDNIRWEDVLHVWWTVTLPVSDLRRGCHHGVTSIDISCIQVTRASICKSSDTISWWFARFTFSEEAGTLTSLPERMHQSSKLLQYAMCVCGCFRCWWHLVSYQDRYRLMTVYTHGDIHSAAPLGDRATNTLSWYPTQSH